MKSIHDTFSSSATIIRDYEDVPYASPEIGIRFMAKDVPLYSMLNDVVGDHATEPYHQFGKYYSSGVVIRVSCKEPQAGGINDAAGTVDTLERALRNLIRKDWPSLLYQHGAFIVRKSDIVATNASFMVGAQRFPAKAMQFDIGYLDTWDYVPDEADRHDPAESFTIETELLE